MLLMSPVSFIQNPVLWLDLMARYRVQWTVAPDFSLNLVARKFQEKSLGTKSELDLSHLRYITSAAEPCRPETQRRFSEVFQPQAAGSSTRLVFVRVGFFFICGFAADTNCVA